MRTLSEHCRVLRIHCCKQRVSLDGNTPQQLIELA